MLGVCLKILLPHLNFSLQSRWKYTLLGLAIFPLTPLFGAVSMGWAILGTLLQQYRAVVSRPLHRGFMLLSVLLILTASFAYNKTEAFVGLFNFLPYFVVFASFSVLIQTVSQLRQLSWMLVITSVPVIVVGLGQLLLGWATPPQGWIGFLGWAIAPGGEPPGRMSSIFMYANSLAGYLIIVFILELGLWVEHWRLGIGETRETRETREHFLPCLPLLPCLPSLPFLFLTLAIILNLVALILTNSRNAWAIAIFACLAYALYQGWRILVATVSGVAASVLLAAFAPTPIALLFRQFIPRFFWARLNDELYPDRPVALLRKTQWQFAISMAQDRPWTGWGLRNFTVLYEAKMQIWLGHPHSLFLMLFAEIGLPATLFFCGLLCWIFVGGVQLLQNSKYVEAKDKTILFSYLVFFIGWVLFNTVDVSLFDFRLNVISWLLFAALSGVVYHYNQQHKIANEKN
ncbi:polymerase [Scytonema sp. UIC 10036]|uniref:O-antigen ligase family protein n=1 Tax=Scytonema sp. UIC 10036 TaxID=2304196 RepID=UPI0012DABA93|nr:O-antigen ligase family protein [Scytonema sp. UIC 10036]MUH00979.1 polymerase [Scytonema sp. UIC 10036]